MSTGWTRPSNVRFIEGFRRSFLVARVRPDLAAMSLYEGKVPCCFLCFRVNCLQSLRVWCSLAPLLTCIFATSQAPAFCKSPPPHGVTCDVHPTVLTITRCFVMHFFAFLLFALSAERASSLRCVMIREGDLDGCAPSLASPVVRLYQQTVVWFGDRWLILRKPE